MKKTGLVLLLVLIVLVVAGGLFAMHILQAPEYALWTIQADVAENGMSGLKQHLTGDALQMVEMVENVSGSDLVGSIISGFGLGEFLDVVREEFRLIEWELVDLMKGDNMAVAVLGYKYKDSLSGSIELTLVKQDKGWTIDEIGLPDVETIDFTW